MAQQTIGEAPPHRPLQVPAFRSLWLNQLAFFFVANSLRFVFGWVVLDGLKRDESVQGLVVFMLGLPSLFLLLPAGVWTDRLNRRNMLIATQLAMVAVMAITALALGDGAGTVGLLVASALVAGATTAVGQPVRQALVPALLPPQLLLGGIALGALAMTTSLIGGAVTAKLVGDRFGFDGAFWYLAILTLAGALVLITIGAVTAKLVGDRFGFDGAFWYLAILTLAGALVLITIKVPTSTAPTGERPTMRAALDEGNRFVWEQRSLRSLFILLGTSGLIMTPLMFVTLQALVKGKLGRSSSEVAPLLALMGVGLAITSIFVMRRGSLKNKGVLFIRAMLGGCTTLALMGLATNYGQLMVLAVVMGMCGGFFINMNQSLIQANTPEHLMGRVMGLYALVQSGMMPFGALLLGFAASRIGVSATMTGGALIGLSVVIWMYVTATELKTLE